MERVYIIRAPGGDPCDPFNDDHDGQIVGVYATRELAEKMLEEVLKDPFYNPAAE